MEKNRFLKEYFDNSILVIPSYQRYYEWKVENCNRLFEDLINAANSQGNRRNHFFGSVITLIDQNSTNTAVIDGQQRITTIALLMAAIRDVLDDPDSGIISSIDSLSSKIDRLLKDQDDGHLFIRHVEKDSIPYQIIIYKKNDEFEGVSNIKINYDLFVNLLKKNVPSKVSIDALFEAISNLYIMPIRLTHEDDAQAVFESINSTGLDLQESDKIRNFILMNHPVDYQNKYYKEYWQKIENNVDNISAFFRHYLIATSPKVPAMNKVYDTFKKVFTSRQNTGTEDEFEMLLAEILEYSKYYRMIVNHDFGSRLYKASTLMHHINRLDLTVTYPFFLSIVRDWKIGAISDDDFTEIISIQHNVLIRRVICSINSTGLNSFYNGLYRNISNLSSSDTFVEKLKYLVINRNTIDYPSDDEVRDAFRNTDLYRSARKDVAGVVLATIESISKETGNIMERMITKPPTVSIEHIMPQNPTDAWREEVGFEEYRSVHGAYLHKLGNLTLTGYNSEMSDHTFEKKKTMSGGFIDSPLFLNESVKSQSRWNKEAIINRQEILIDEFFRVVPHLTSTCVLIQSEELKVISVENEKSMFTNLSVKGYYYRERKIECPNGMSDVLIDLVRKLFEENPDLFYKLASEGKFGPKINTVGYPEDLKQVAVVYDKIYINKRSNNPDKIWTIRSLLEHFGINQSDVSIYGYQNKPRARRGKNVGQRSITGYL